MLSGFRSGRSGSSYRRSLISEPEDAFSYPSTPFEPGWTPSLRCSWGVEMQPLRECSSRYGAVMNKTCKINSSEIGSDIMAPRRKTSGRGGSRPGAGRKPELEEAVSVTLHLERPQIDHLRKIADEEDVSVASLIRAAVNRFLARRKNRGT